MRILKQDPRCCSTPPPPCPQAKAVPYSTDGAVEFNVVTTNAATEGECAFLERLQSNPARRRRGVVSANSIRTALEQLSEAKLLKLARMPPAPPAAAAEFTVMTAHATIFLAGRYLKRARNVSQTPWFVGTKRMTELNVEVGGGGASTHTASI